MSAKNASVFIGTPRIIFGFAHVVNELLGYLLSRTAKPEQHLSFCAAINYYKLLIFSPLWLGSNTPPSFSRTSVMLIP